MQRINQGVNNKVKEGNGVEFIVKRLGWTYQTIAYSIADRTIMVRT